jgi:hypothetical protein
VTIIIGVKMALRMAVSKRSPFSVVFTNIVGHDVVCDDRDVGEPLGSMENRIGLREVEVGRAQPVRNSAQAGVASLQIKRGPRLGREPRRYISFPGAEAGAWGHPSSFPLRGR